MNFAFAQYQQTKIETGSRTQVLVSLYEGALRFLRTALEQQNVPSARGIALGKAHSIIAELSATLDPAAAPDLCAQLASLYDFSLARISEATVRGDATHVQPVIDVLDKLLSAWKQIQADELRTVGPVVR